MRNNAASIIGNGVILLLWQLRCHCNPDHDKFSSLSNTTVVAIFPNVCLWQRIVYAQTWQVYIDPENQYWGTFVCQYAGLCCCIVWPLFLFDCFVKIWPICNNVLGKWSTAPPPLAENCPYAYAVNPLNPRVTAYLFLLARPSFLPGLWKETEKSASQATNISSPREISMHTDQLW